MKKYQTGVCWDIISYKEERSPAFLSKGFYPAINNNNMFG
jgi:hypothetical protein